MGVEEDVKKFEDWAESMGIPPNVMPPKKAIIRIFSSSHSLAFMEMMRRIRPQDEVKAVRDELKVRKIERINGKNIAVKRIQSEEMYLYQKKKKLEERLQSLKERVASQKKEYKKLAISCKENNIQKMQVKKEISDIVAKNAIAKLKKIDIERQIIIEKEVGKKIDEITPVKFTLNMTNEKLANEALTAANVELQRFYSTFNHTEQYEVNLVSRQQLWERLREIFSQIPNVSLWSNINDQMKQKLNAMEALSMMDMQKVLYIDSDSNSQNSLHLDTDRLYAKHVKLCVMRHCVLKQSDNITKDYVVCYQSFLDNLRSKFQMYNHQSIDDEFLADYLGVYSTLHYGKGEIEFLLKVTADNELEINRRKKNNEQFLIANVELSNIYEEMEKLYIRANEEIYSLTHVREKIQHSEDLMRYLLQCKKENPLQSMIDVRMNMSINSSFGSNNDSILHQSRSDSLNSSAMFGRIENVRSAAKYLPNQLNEIKTFFSTPIDKFKLRNPLQENLDLCANPLVDVSIYNRLPDTVRRLCTDHLMTPAASIKNIRSQVTWMDQMKVIESAFEPPDNKTEFDEAKVTARKRKQHDTLAELTDETGAICSNVHRIHGTTERYVQYINENPLAKWIPARDTFNGRTYADYEREFMMYYNMIATSEDE